MHRTALNTAIALIVLACLILNSQQQSSLNNQKQDPRKLTPKKQLSPKAKQIKKDWFELIHRAADTVDWRRVEFNNAMDKLKRNQEFSVDIEREQGTIEIANGKLIGNWQELGPTNLAGDIKRAVYSESQDRVYAISAGKTMWRGKLDGSQWEVVNDFIPFDHHILEIVTLDDGTELIFASMGGQLVYSADGNLWPEANGLGSLSEVKDMFVMDNGEVFILSKSSPASTVKLYKSTTADNGSLDPKNYTDKFDFFTLDMDDVAIATDTKKENLFGIMYDLENREIYSYFYDQNIDNLVETSTYDISVIANYPLDEARLFVSTRDIGGDIFIKLTRVGRFGTVYYSESKFIDKNFGSSWAAENQDLTEAPWFDAYTILDDQQTHIMGREECYYSIAGSNWEKVNEWEDYYEDPENKLHIDIMQVREFKKGNQAFTLICTHGGIYYTEDISEGVKNITLNGMNNAQFYDVVSLPLLNSPFDANWIMAGSQDQGWQRGRIQSEDPPIEFIQILSGDYGHIKIREDLGVWMSFPEGVVKYYPNVLSPFNFESSDNGVFHAEIDYKVKKPQEQVWISPVMLHPDPAFQNTLLIAGGSINENQSGSYLIRVKEIADGIVEEFQYEQDFSFANGEISAIESDPNDINKWYITTTSGQFYFSNDAGTTWIKTSPTVPGVGGVNELYGTDILVSKDTPGTLYVSGSGYSNAPVYKSTDGGFTFTPFDNGLTNTTVFELDYNGNESLIFAATEKGPYVYLRAKGEWYPMDGNMAPTQAYWSVDYIEEIETARFGTYGRGVWQFEIESFTSNKNLASISEQVTIYPNPSSESINIQTEFFGNISQYEVLTLAGNFIFGAEITTHQDISIPVSQLAQGAYLLRLRHKEGYIFKKFVKI